jgi:hypothetical protein
MNGPRMGNDDYWREKARKMIQDLRDCALAAEKRQDQNTARLMYGAADMIADLSTRFSALSEAKSAD